MTDHKKILLTGASGFLGKGIIRYFENMPENQLFLVYRKNNLGPNKRHFCVGNINGSTDFSMALSGKDVVIHTAGRAHIMNDNSTSPLAAFREVNVKGTLNLAAQAVQAGIKRFIFISSTKVNGDLTLGSNVFSEVSIPDPKDPYGLSKYEAEQGLLKLASRSNMEVVIIRPPLVYGPGVKGNFATLIRVVKSGFPLPIALINNKRSLIALDNLVDLIATCISHPNAVNQVFLASDGEDISSLSLIKKIAIAFDLNPYIFPFSITMMKIATKLIGRGLIADRLFGDHRVDISKVQKMLNWKPVISIDEQMQKIANYHNPIEIK